VGVGVGKVGLLRLRLDADSIGNVAQRVGDALLQMKMKRIERIQAEQFEELDVVGDSGPCRCGKNPGTPGTNVASPPPLPTTGAHRHRDRRNLILLILSWSTLPPVAPVFLSLYTALTHLWCFMQLALQRPVHEVTVQRCAATDGTEGVRVQLQQFLQQCSDSRYRRCAAAPGTEGGPEGGPDGVQQPTYRRQIYAHTEEGTKTNLAPG